MTDTNKGEVVDPWTVEGAFVDNKQMSVDYNRLIDKFGTKKITPELLARFERLTGRKPHRFLRRGIFFSHRDLDVILDRFEKAEPFYIFTGRGPSSDAMHLGHYVPFFFCKYLQDVFNVPIVIQMSDDEKFFFKKELSLEQAHKYAYENGKDILACGFNPKLTYLFSDFETVNGAFYHNICRIADMLTLSQCKNTFGFTDSSSLGCFFYTSVQMAPSISSTFPHIFGDRSDIPVIITAAIDQDPYFRLSRDVTPRLGVPKCVSIYSEFFPALQGLQSKMSASIDCSAIFLTDSPGQIKNKINKFAFSGGQSTTEKQRELGADCAVDVPFQYLRFFLDDDCELAEIESKYSAGKMLTGEVKEICINVLTEIITEVQKKRSAITDDHVVRAMDKSQPMEYGVENGFVGPQPKDILTPFQLLSLNYEKKNKTIPSKHED